jgi:hypothetical protein
MQGSRQCGHALQQHHAGRRVCGHQRGRGRAERQHASLAFRSAASIPAPNLQRLTPRSCQNSSWNVSSTWGCVGVDTSRETNLSACALIAALAELRAVPAVTPERLAESAYR